MRVLQATQEQFQALNGFKNGLDELVFDDRMQVGLQVLDYPAFSEINEQLHQLEIIEVETNEVN